MQIVVVVETGDALEASARMFVESASLAGHQVPMVFFYHDGARCALGNIANLADEPRISGLWASLAERFDLKLAVCVNAARRRGIFDKAEAAEASTSVTLAKGFKLIGLAQYLDRAATADRVVRFR